MTQTTSLLRFTIGMTLALGIAATVPAQTTNGTIQGTVLDPSGALVPHAQITVSNANGFMRTVKSSATGSFAVAHLAPGSYSVSINAMGFTPALEGSVRVAGDKVTRENVRLNISVNQEIEVSANDAPDAEGTTNSGR